MTHRKHQLYTAAVVVVAAAATIAATALGGTAKPNRPQKIPPGAAVITVQAGRPGRAIPPGFLGLSLEFPAVTAYAGVDPQALNPIFVRLVRNLTPGQRPVLRIGGDSTDWTWWPTAAINKPPGVRITLTRRWLDVANALQRALDAKLILGINLEAGSGPLASAEAHAFTGNLHGIEALEPGNEPELYPSFGWYHTRAGQQVPGRPPGYDFAAFMHEFSRFADLLRAPLAGPATGSAKWMQAVPGFLASASSSRLKLVTLHRYPLQQCYTPANSPIFPTLGTLLSDLSSRGLAASVARDVDAAHARHRPLRIDEMNTISCGGSPMGHAPATALWAADALFSMVAVGADGVNVHSYPGATYDLFRFKHRDGIWTARVEPEYYGLLLFAQAAPANSRLLAVSQTNPDSLRTWATKAPDGRIRLLVINDDLARSRTVAIKPAARATIERLTSTGITEPAPLPTPLTTLRPMSAVLITLNTS